MRQERYGYKAGGEVTAGPTYTDSGTGVLRSAHIEDGRPRDVTVISDVFGQAIRRDEVDRNTGGDPHELWYRFDGRQLGYVGNNGTLNGDYTSSIAQRTRAPTGTAAFRGGATAGSPAADFDQAYDAINSYSQGGTAGSYSVRSGDTLAGIATQLWGDASLWYKLAQANGLAGDSGLTAGTTLAIPGGVSRSGNSAATSRPYDPGDAYGDTSPTTPKPQAARKGNNCGVFGQILLVAVAVAVTIVSYGSLGPVGAAIAGNVASQGVGLATGIQQTFDFRSVALSGIAGGVAQGLGAVIGETAVFGSEVATAAVTGALASAITQGIGVTIGLQSTFDFAGVAAAGLGAGAGQALGGSFAKLGKVGSRLAVNTAGGLVNATVRSLASGTDFGDNLIAALPDVIGQTVGGLAGEAIGGSRSHSPAAGSSGGQDQPGPIDPALRAAIDNFNAQGRASAIPSAAASAPVAMAGGGQVDKSGDIVVTADKDALAQARLSPYQSFAGGQAPVGASIPTWIRETYGISNGKSDAAQWLADYGHQLGPFYAQPGQASQFSGQFWDQLHHDPAGQFAALQVFKGFAGDPTYGGFYQEAYDDFRARAAVERDIAQRAYDHEVGTAFAELGKQELSLALGEGAGAIAGKFLLPVAARYAAPYVERLGSVFSKGEVAAESGLLPSGVGGTGAAYNKATGQGLYVLRDELGNVRYIGRGDAPARISTHADSIDKSELIGEVLYTNNLTKAQAKGLEQRLINEFGGATAHVPESPLLNKINSYSSANPNASLYRDAATEALWQNALKKVGR